MFKKSPKWKKDRLTSTKSLKHMGIGLGEGVKFKDLNARQKRIVFLTYITSFAIFCVLLGTLVVLASFAFYSRELPDPDILLERSDELSSKLYDRNGKPLFEVYGEKNRTLIKVEDVSQDLVHATLAVEDANFYNHRGFYFLGMVRAVKNTLTGQGLQGGSTLTQQVVKNSVLTQDRTITRKLKEFILALQLENKYSKEQILQMYFNETPYGGQNYGIFTAARAYFNKTPNDLTLAEAAYIAGLPQRPSYYSHFGANPQAGLERKDYVLFLMKDKGWIGPDGNRQYLSQDAYDTAMAQELEFERPQAYFNAPHFVFYAKDYLSELFGSDVIEQGGLQVTTTLDLDMQNTAQEIVLEELEKVTYLNIGNGSLVAIKPGTGEILAMVGSKDYFGDPYPEGCVSGVTGEEGCLFDPNVNVTTSARQPGSSIKPITYATMLSQGYTAAFPFMDVETKFQGATPDKPYIPNNFDGKFRGPMSMRRALANSLNIPAVKALKIVGVDNMIDQAEKLGISTLTERERYGLALTLGGGETKLLEMTNAFATFGNKGMYVAPTPILKVEDAAGNVLYEHKPIAKRAVSEEVSFIVADMLSDDGARSTIFGTGGALNIPGVAVKTGTTDDARDNYAIGFTPDIAVGTWVGNSNNEPMNSIASGGIGATQTWRRAMIDFLSTIENPQKFEPPENVQKIEVDALTGMLPYEDFPSRPEWFVKGTEPTAPSNWYQRLEICKEDGLLANNSCKDANKTEVKSFISIQAELPEWQVYVDKWVGENYSGDEVYFPPRTTSGLEFDDGKVKKNTAPKVSIANFKDGDVAPLEFRLQVEVSTPNDIEEVRIYMDGESVTTDKSEPYGFNFTLSPNQAGEHMFSAVAEDDDGREGKTEIKLKIVQY